MLKDILNFRRAVRYYAPTPISEEKVRECLKLATLAPTGFNMQLYELYHITDKALLEKLAHACLDQLTASTAQQMVVFVTRQDKHRQHAKMILEFERGNIQRNSPPERQAKRIKDKESLYEKLIPFVYSRVFGFLCCFRKIDGVCGLFGTDVGVQSVIVLRLVLCENSLKVIYVWKYIKAVGLQRKLLC